MSLFWVFRLDLARSWFILDSTESVLTTAQLWWCHWYYVLPPTEPLAVNMIKLHYPQAARSQWLYWVIMIKVSFEIFIVCAFLILCFVCTTLDSFVQNSCHVSYVHAASDNCVMVGLSLRPLHLSSHHRVLLCGLNSKISGTNDCLSANNSQVLALLSIAALYIDTTSVFNASLVHIHCSNATRGW